MRDTNVRRVFHDEQWKNCGLVLSMVEIDDAKRLDCDWGDYDKEALCWVWFVGSLS